MPKRAPARIATPCADCEAETLSTEPGVPTEFYMVRNDVWAAAGGPERGYLCIGCLEVRLGRRLTRPDFTDAPVDDLAIAPTPRYAWSWRSDRLRDRLAA